MRNRENLIGIALLALLAIAPRFAGPCGISVFCTIVFAGLFGLLASRLALADPRPNARGYALTALTAAVLAYPLALLWFGQTSGTRLPDLFMDSGLVCVLGGVSMLLFVVAAYRRYFFPAIFGRERRSRAREARPPAKPAAAPGSDRVVDLEAAKRNLRR